MNPKTASTKPCFSPCCSFILVISAMIVVLGKAIKEFWENTSLSLKCREERSCPLLFLFTQKLCEIQSLRSSCH